MDNCQTSDSPRTASHLENTLRLVLKSKTCTDLVLISLKSSGKAAQLLTCRIQLLCTTYLGTVWVECRNLWYTLLQSVFSPLSKLRKNSGEPEAGGQLCYSPLPDQCIALTRDRLFILNKLTSRLLPDWNTAKVFTFFSVCFTVCSMVPFPHVYKYMAMLSCAPLRFIHWIPVLTTYAELVLHQQLTCSFFCLQLLC